MKHILNEYKRGQFYSIGYLTSRWMPMFQEQKKYADPIGCGLFDEKIGFLPVFEDALASGDILTIRRLLKIYLKRLKEYPQHITEPRLRNAMRLNIAMNENLINKLENDDSAMQELFKYWENVYERAQSLFPSSK